MNLARPAALLTGVLVTSALVAGCSKAPDGAGVSAMPGVPIEDNFGAGFAQAFRAAPDSVPMNPSPSSVVPVDPYGQPLRIP